MSALHLTVRLATRLLQAAIALVVALYLLLGAGLLTLRYGVLPNAQRFVPWLEAASTRALGLPVHIGAVQANWQGLLPTLSMRNLVIDDAQGHPALRLDSVQALPSWKSLPRMQLAFEQLAISGAQLRITRIDADHLEIGGIRVDLHASAGGGQRFADWLFSQDQLLVRDSDIVWVDRTRDAAPLELRHVQLELRNTLLRHRAALRAVPPPQLGDTLQLRADMRQPWFDRHPGDLAAWHGQLWADLPRFDLDALARWVRLPSQLDGGVGALRAWLQVGRDYQPQSLTVATSLARLGLHIDPALPPLQLQSLAGRLRWRALAGGEDVEVSDLKLRAADGTQLASPLLQWRDQHAPGKAREGSLRVAGVDLGVVDALARSLPLPAGWHARLRELQPRGRIERASLSWQGDWGTQPGSGAHALPPRYALQAAFSGLAWRSPGAALTTPAPARHELDEAGLPRDLPGVQGLDGSVDASQDGGSAHLHVQDGAVALPTVFEEPSLPLKRLDAHLTWSRRGDGPWEVRASQIQLQTPDATGTVDLRYTSQPAGPGLLDLDARLSRAELRAVPRYLPLGIGASTRDYLRSALAGGSSRDVHFVVRGPLASFPFEQPASGVFRVDARIDGGIFSPAPRRLLPPGRQARAEDVAANAQWPEFHDVQGDFHFTSRGMSARDVRARVGSATLQGVQLDLPQYTHPVLRAQGMVRAQADVALHYLRASPLDDMLSHTLSDTHASGPLQLQLALTLPLDHLDDTRVQGRLQMLGDNVDYLPWLPTIHGVRGDVEFSERSFTLRLDADRFAGGPLRVRGGQTAGAGVHVQADGNVSAAAMRDAPQLRAWRPLLARLQGSTPLQVRIDAAAGQAHPAVQVRSNLAGMAIDLPQPLGKAAAASQALRVSLDDAHAASQHWRVELGQELRAQGLLDAGSDGNLSWHALGLALGAQAALPQPTQGVQANIELPVLDVDAWQRALSSPDTTAAGAADSAPGNAPASPGGLQRSWLPDVLALHVGRLLLGGRVFDDVVLGATRSQSLWQANLHSAQLDGSLNWRMGAGDSPGSISARLSRLVLPKTADSDVESLLDDHLRSLPAIDLDASNVDLHGHHFDSLQLHADNRGSGAQRHWQLGSVRLVSPDAVLSASGDWSPSDASGAAQHRMSLRFRLDVNDAGGLLARLGRPGLLRGGKGVLQGQLSWLGSPLALDYPTLSGQFALDLGQGQFLKADQGISKLLGVLSLQSLPRRLMLNFRDVFSSGFAFDKVSANVQLRSGVARTSDFRMNGLAATVFIDGSADLARETQDLSVVVVPDINAGSASLAYALINPAIGLGTFIAQLIAREPLAKALTYGYRITGTWTHPEMREQDAAQLPSQAPSQAPSRTPAASTAQAPERAPASTPAPGSR